MPYIVKAGNVNRLKNKNYLQRFGQPVFDSQCNGIIINQNVIREIQNNIN